MRQRDLENNNALSQSQETKIQLAMRGVNGNEEENNFFNSYIFDFDFKSAISECNR